MDKFEKIKTLVGESLIETVLKKAAFDALTDGNWYQVLSIAEFAMKELKGKGKSPASLNGLETREEIRIRSRSNRDLRFSGDD